MKFENISLGIFVGYTIMSDITGIVATTLSLMIEAPLQSINQLPACLQP